MRLEGRIYFYLKTHSTHFIYCLWKEILNDALNTFTVIRRRTYGKGPLSERNPATAKIATYTKTQCVSA